jgi:hypothetical protein
VCGCGTCLNRDVETRCIVDYSRPIGTSTYQRCFDCYYKKIVNGVHRHITINNINYIVNNMYDDNSTMCAICKKHNERSYMLVEIVNCRNNSYVCRQCLFPLNTN